MRKITQIFILICLLTSALRAHVVEQLFAEFSTTATTWELRIRFDAGYASSELRGDADAPQPRFEWLSSKTPDELESLRQVAESYLKTIFTFSGAAAEYRFPAWRTDPPSFTQEFTDLGFAYFDVVIHGSIPTDGPLLISSSSGQQPILLIQITQTNNDPVYLSLIPGSEIELIKADHRPRESHETFSSYLHFGFRHVIPEGWDHILFILCLVLMTLKLRPLVSQSLAFTAAHTITLGLSVAGVIPSFSQFWQSSVEILIALSILCLALQNIFYFKAAPSPEDRQKHRLPIVFAFGLIHGLGFASVLAETLRRAGDFGLPLLAANLGVELGQLAVIIVGLALLFPFRHKRYLNKILVIASFIVGGFGLYWTIERLVGLAS